MTSVQFTERECLDALLWEINASPTSEQQEARIIAEDRIPRGFEILRKRRVKAAPASPPTPKPKLPYWTVDRVNDCLASMKLMEVHSLDAVIDRDEPGGQSYLDLVADPSSEGEGPAFGHDSLEPILRAIDGLSERERFVVQSKIIDRKTLVQVSVLLAEVEGGDPLSRERVRQIYEQGIFNIRRSIGIVGRAA